MAKEKQQLTHWRSVGIVGLVMATVFLAGCATSGNPRDPLEPLNRAVYGFNDGFDRAIAKPVAEGYRNIVPAIVRTGVSNFFSNLDDIWVALNNLLQGKAQQAADDFGRVVINSSIGLLGIIDVASDAGLEKHNEDFGQTLGTWGVGSGPYLVLPFLGSSTVRDGLSYALVDVKADFVAQTDHVPTRNSLYVTRAISLRAGLLDASRIVEEAALDKYSFTRDAYLQRRRSLVFDGNPPREDSAEIDFGTVVGEQQPEPTPSSISVAPPVEQTPSSDAGLSSVTDRTAIAVSPAFSLR